jgi:hypothetical protein
MPGASVKVGPVRVGSGCCVALLVPVLLAVAIGALILPVSAQAFVTSFKTSPKHPYVDESMITISWKTDRNLKAGYHYTGSISVTDETHYKCRGAGVGGSGEAFASSKKNVHKGSIMRLSFDSFSSPDLLGQENEGYLEWCPGKATVTIYETKNGEPIAPGGEIVGIGSFRFYTKP